MKSDLAAVEQEYVGAAGGEGLQVCDRGLPLRAREGLLDRRQIVELQQRDEMERTCTDEAITEAMTKPPETTRARLRGAFVKRAKERRRDFTVDWVHLKLNDQAQRTVLLKDPFKSHDERVERLIQSL